MKQSCLCKKINIFLEIYKYVVMHLVNATDLYTVLYTNMIQSFLTKLRMTSKNVGSLRNHGKYIPLIYIQQ